MSTNVTKRFRQGFTLVELLVVIGIIGLLISVLLPALNKARQSANSVACQANLHQMGQLLMTYSAEHRGWLPYGRGQIKYDPNSPFGDGWWDTSTWTWTDTLQLMLNGKSQSDGGTDPTMGAEFTWLDRSYLMNAAYSYSKVFKDTDGPAMGEAGPRVCYYTANARILADPLTHDGYGQAATGKTNVFMPLRNVGSIRQAGSTMVIWCSGLDLSSGVDMATAEPVCWQLDGSQVGASWGTGFSNPTAASYANPALANRIALANDGVHNSLAGNLEGSVGLKVLQSQNIDRFSAVGSNINDMRFRHLGNKSVNSLFADFHAESRALGDVRAKDVCVNPVSPYFTWPGATN